MGKLGVLVNVGVGEGVAVNVSVAVGVDVGVKLKVSLGVKVGVDLNVGVIEDEGTTLLTSFGIATAMIITDRNNNVSRAKPPRSQRRHPRLPVLSAAMCPVCNNTK